MSHPILPASPLPSLYELEPAPAVPRTGGRLGNALYRGRWLVVAVVAGFVLLALVLSHWIRPYYEASGSIIIQHAVLHNAEITPQEYPPPVDADRELQTELTIMQSRAVVGAVVVGLQLETADPEIRAALAGTERGLARQHEHLSAARGAQIAYGVFSSKLQLLPDKLSDAVQIEYGSHDAALAAAVVNALMEEFLHQALAQRGADGAQTSVWM
ncbi:MAG: Wzz/FepE/Etk N-terminal domain-containing protein, partial [Terriglobales bacterium]